jgi:hypothetical protein
MDAFSLDSIRRILDKMDYIWEDEEIEVQELLKKIKGQDDIRQEILERLKILKIQTFGTTTTTTTTIPPDN